MAYLIRLIFLAVLSGTAVADCYNYSTQFEKDECFMRDLKKSQDQERQREQARMQREQIELQKKQLRIQNEQLELQKRHGGNKSIVKSDGESDSYSAIMKLLNELDEKLQSCGGNITFVDNENMGVLQACESENVIIYATRSPEFHKRFTGRNGLVGGCSVIMNNEVGLSVPTNCALKEKKYGYFLLINIGKIKKDYRSFYEKLKKGEFENIHVDVEFEGRSFKLVGLLTVR